ncbi:MAG: ABC transporter permease [Bryobacteraceae bacterium]
MLWRGKRKQEDFSQEIESHIGLEAERLMADGMSPKEAQAAARRAFGNAAAVQERFYESKRLLWLDHALQDLRFALRTLRENPGFALAAIGVLALTIGSVAAMFSFVDAILLRPLPYTDPERVVMVWETRKDAPRRSGASAPWADPRQAHVSAANLRDWSGEQRVFEHMEPLVYGWFNIHATEQVMGGRAGTRFFEMLGTRAALGRTFGPDDEGRAVAILTHALWRRRFGADPAILGRAIDLGGDTAYTVIGVLPPDFFFYLNDFQLWTPLDLSPRQYADRSARRLLVAARLKPGISLIEAQAAMTGIAGRLEQAHPDTNRDWSVLVVPATEQFTSFLGPIVVSLFAAVTILMLVGGVNVASLSLARIQIRQREIAIRLALGASRLRILQLFWMEALLLTLTGAVAGLLLASMALPQLVALLPVKLPIPIPGLANIAVGERIVLFAAALSVLTSILLAALPALRASAPDLSRRLKETASSHSGGVGEVRFFDAVVVAQTALAILLLAGAGVTIKSLWRLIHREQGFERNGVLAFRIPVSGIRHPNSGRFHDRVLNDVAQLPAVLSAALAYEVPLGGTGRQTAFQIEGRMEKASAGTNAVGSNYFRTLQIPHRSGRDFSSGDTMHSQPVAIVSESLARKHWTGRDPVGQRIRLGNSPGEPWTLIVGVVGDVRSWVNGPPAPIVYRPYQQAPSGAMGYVVRAATDPSSLGPAVERAIHAIDPEQPVTFLRALEEDFIDQIYAQRVSAIGLAAFAGAALLLAATGVFSTAAYSVRRRNREFGIRLALGALPYQILVSVVWHGIKFAALGSLIGIGVAVAANRLLASILFEVQPADPEAFGVVVAILAAVAVSACFLAAREATRIDPARTLRQE